MSTQRYISTSFWDDPWVQGLDPSEKFIYMYLLTNPLTNIAGIYEVTIRRITFDTGYNDETVIKVLKRFEEAKKAYHYDSFIILPSWPKHQKWEKSPKIKAGIEACLEKLPVNIKKYTLSIGYQYPLNYLDLDINKDIDLDTDINIDTPRVEKPKEIDQPRNFAKEWETCLSLWNSLDLPQYKVLLANERDAGQIKNWMVSYDLSEIEGAIVNYSRLIEHINQVYRYRTYRAFIEKGLSQFFDGAKPDERYKNANKEQSEKSSKFAEEMFR